ncbi:protease SohB [Thiohalocapsa marina]|uniref:protease SohB n=1 Tax=Thiohalocapsa marina TaxID=424902 RepID=UPI0036DEC9A7
MTEALIQALFDYGLFLAKALTLVFALGLLGLLLMRLRLRVGDLGQNDDGELLVQNLTHRFADMADEIKRNTLPPKAFKQAMKQERKQEKQRAKAVARDRRRVFVIDFHGDIMATEVAGLREVVSALLMEADAEDEVLVRLDNAGGAVHEHGLAASQLLRIREHGLSLTVAVDKVAASGGYLMACVANRIVAAPFAVVGSIGVLAEMPNFHRWLERNGVDFELHTAGEYKRTLTLFGENTDEGRAKLREQLEETHQLFKSFIQTYRPDLDLARVATGEYWHGEQALALGLVDALKTSDDYLLAARADADLYRLSYKAHKRPLDRLLGAIRLGMSALASRLPLAVSRGGG